MHSLLPLRHTSPSPPFACAQGDLEFNVEVSIMAGLDHPNVVPLLGSCCEADHRVAVFDYMPHGNLRDLLDSKTPAARHFNWPARLNVLLGVAKGLHYLHSVSTLCLVWHAAINL